MSRVLRRDYHFDTLLKFVLCTSMSRWFLRAGLLATVLLGGALLSTTAEALNPDTAVGQYVRESWNERDGLGEAGALSVVESSDGYLWVGTPSGVLRFDGQRFSPMGQSPGVGQYSFVREILAAPDGVLLAATAGGLLEMNGNDSFLYAEAHGLKHPFVYALTRGADGSVWVATGGEGVFRYQEGRFTLHPAFSQSSLPGNVVDLATAPDGTLWAATDAGVVELTETPLVYTQEHGLPSSVVSTLLFDAEGSLWVGTRAGLAKSSSGGFSELTSEEGESLGEVSALHQDIDGSLWIGLRDGGLYRLAAGLLERTTSAPSLGGVLAIHEDSAGDLWLAREGGLERLREGPFVTHGRHEGLTSNRILALLSSKDGGLWVLDGAGAVYRHHKGQFTQLAPPGTVQGEGMLGLAESEDGSLWIGAETLQRFHDGRVQHFDNPGGDFSVVAKDEFGLLVVQTRRDGQSSVSHFDGEGFRALELGPLRHVQRLFHGREERLWITTGGSGVVEVTSAGRTRYTEAQGLPHDVTYGVVEDTRGVAWVSTRAGLARIEGGTVRSLAGIEGVPTLAPMHLHVDAAGYLWVSADDGIHRVSIAELDAVARGETNSVNGVRFGKSDGLRSIVVSWRPNGQATTADGRLWYATERGLAVADPALAGPDLTPPQPSIEAVFVDGEHQNHSPLQLPNAAGRIELHFGAPAISGDTVEYRYRMSGYERDWVLAGGRRFAQYTNLGGGDYRFEASARRNGGAWSPAATARVIVAPAWFDSVWARGGLAGLTLLSLYLVYFVRVRQLKRRELELLAKVDERTKDLEQEIAERRQAEEQVRRLNFDLEGDAKERTLQLMTVNQALIEDVQKRQEAEAQLADEKERLQVTLSSIAEGVIAVDEHGRISLMNRLAEATTGYSSEEATGKLLDEVFVVVDPVHKRPLGASVMALLSANEPQSPDELRQAVLVSRGAEEDDAERLVDASVAPIRDGSERRVGAVLVFRDVTARVRAEETLRKTQKLESLGVLAGGIAHDFNNMLTGIFCHVDMARRTVPEENAARRWLDDTMAVLDNAKGLARQLLTFASGGQPTLESHSLGELLRDSSRFVLSGSRIRSELDIPSDLWPCDMDPVQIRQLVDNLILNARQALEDMGTLHITATNLTAAPEARGAGSNDPYPERWVEIAIRDDGPGIEPDIVDRIFDPFFSTKATGSGLGLATVHSIATKHGGKIDVESQLGKGTTFRLRLRAASTPAVSTLPRAPRASAQAEQRSTVLVMDDEYPIRRVAEAALEGAGYRVLLAESGEQAVELFANSLASTAPVDLVILDLTVTGGMGGAEALTQLRELSPGLAAIASSGYAAGTVLGDPKAHGFNAALPKPYTVDDLVAAVETMLRVA